MHKSIPSGGSNMGYHFWLTVRLAWHQWVMRCGRLGPLVLRQASAMVLQDRIACVLVEAGQLHDMGQGRRAHNVRLCGNTPLMAPQASGGLENPSGSVHGLSMSRSASSAKRTPYGIRIGCRPDVCRCARRIPQRAAVALLDLPVGAPASLGCASVSCVLHIGRRPEVRLSLLREA